MKIDGHELCIDNVRYVPDLAESIYSLFLHIKCPHHGLQSSFEDGLKIIFPEFTTSAILGKDDIYLDAVPCRSTFKCLSDVQFSHISSSNSVCRHTSQLEQEIKVESAKVDSILNELRRNYQEVKTKRQLNLGVPAGFRRENTTQSNYRHHVNTLLASPPVVDPMFGDPISSDPLCLHSNSTLTEPLTSSAYTQDDPTILPPLTSQVQIPIL
jgi:hypothetical protein